MEKLTKWETLKRFFFPIPLKRAEYRPEMIESLERAREIHASYRRYLWLYLFSFDAYYKKQIGIQKRGYQMVLDDFYKMKNRRENCPLPQSQNGYSDEMNHCLENLTNWWYDIQDIKKRLEKAKSKSDKESEDRYLFQIDTLEKISKEELEKFEALKKQWENDPK